MLSVELRNYGGLPVSGIEIGYTIDGSTQIIETVPFSLSPDSSRIFTFNTSLDLRVRKSYQLSIFLLNPPDENSENDQLEVFIDHFPDFESGITGESVLCPGDRTTLTATGGTSYLWENGVATAALEVQPDTTTTILGQYNQRNGMCKTRIFYHYCSRAYLLPKL